MHKQQILIEGDNFLYASFSFLLDEEKNIVFRFSLSPPCSLSLSLSLASSFSTSFPSSPSSLRHHHWRYLMDKILFFAVARHLPCRHWRSTGLQIVLVTRYGKKMLVYNPPEDGSRNSRENLSLSIGIIPTFGKNAALPRLAFNTWEIGNPEVLPFLSSFSLPLSVSLPWHLLSTNTILILIIIINSSVVLSCFCCCCCCCRLPIGSGCPWWKITIAVSVTATLTSHTHHSFLFLFSRSLMSDDIR